MNRQQRLLLTTWVVFLATVLLVSIYRDNPPAAGLSLLPLAILGLFYWRELRHFRRAHPGPLAVMQRVPVLKGFCVLGYTATLGILVWLLSLESDTLQGLGLLGVRFLLATPIMPAVVYAQLNLYLQLAESR